MTKPATSQSLTNNNTSPSEHLVRDMLLAKGATLGYENIHHGSSFAPRDLIANFRDWIRHGRGITTIMASGTAFDDKDLLLISSLNNLQCLLIENSTIAEQGLNQILHLPRLSHLYLRGSRVTDKMVTMLPRCKSLEMLDLSLTGIKDESLEVIANCSSLRFLQIYCNGISDRAVIKLQRVRQDLDIQWANRRDAKGAIELIQREATVETNYSGDVNSVVWWDESIADADMELLFNLRGLEIVSILCECGVTDRGLGFLEPLKSLRELYLVNTQITTRGVEQLLSVCSKLEVLDVRGSLVDDGIISTLAAMPILKEIDLRDTKVTHIGLGTLEQTNPRVHVRRCDNVDPVWSKNSTKR